MGACQTDPKLFGLLFDAAVARIQPLVNVFVQQATTAAVTGGGDANLALRSIAEAQQLVQPLRSEFVTHPNAVAVVHAVQEATQAVLSQNSNSTAGGGNNLPQDAQSALAQSAAALETARKHLATTATATMLGPTFVDARAALAVATEHAALLRDHYLHITTVQDHVAELDVLHLRLFGFVRGLAGGMENDDGDGSRSSSSSSDAVPFAVNWRDPVATQDALRAINAARARFSEEFGAAQLLLRGQVDLTGECRAPPGHFAGDVDRRCSAALQALDDVRAMPFAHTHTRTHTTTTTTNDCLLYTSPSPRDRG